MTRRQVMEVSLTLGLMFGAWFVYPPKKALFTDGLLVLAGFAIADILDEGPWVAVAAT